MKKSKVIISLLLIIIILGQYVESLAKSFELKIYFDGKNISMESETTDMSWNLNNILPGQSDTSSVTITNSGSKAATVITTISIEEDNGLLEMIDLKVTGKDGQVVYTGRYNDLETLSKYLEVGESETYTVETTLNVNAGNEYQNKQYKLKFNFKAVGEIPMGTLTIRYVDENGDDIETPTVETREITEEYNLPAEGKALDGYRFSGVVDGELNGPYKEEGTTVVYHYNKIEYGNLLVKYVSDDEDAKVLKKIEGYREEGTHYEYEADNIEGYQFNGKIDGKPEGNYSNGTIEVTFHYNIKYGKLIIQCVDMDGVVFEQTSTTKKVGTKYKLSPQGEEKAGYTFVKTEGKLDGEYKEEDTIVKYIYKLNQEPKPEKGRVIILYVDENENELDKTITTKIVGETYTYTEDEVKKEIPGYVFKKIDGELTGKYKKEDTIIYCRYEKKKEEKGRVIILYVDENENELDRTITTDIVGETYTYTEDEVKKEIPGYVFKKIDGKLTGKYKKEDTIIYCRYEKEKEKEEEEKGRVIILYVDENENELDRTITTDIVGEIYTYTEDEVKKEIPGYVFKKIDGELTGKYKKEDTIIYCRYEKEKEKEEEEKGNVILIYVDEDENVLEKITTKKTVGTPYVYTEDEVNKEIPGYKFKNIEGNLTGNYKKEDTIIYCRYEKIKKGRVIVVCVDENNKIIKQTVYTENVGTEYDLGKTGEKIEGYTFLGVEGETSGKYREEDIIVTYRYERNKAPSTDIIELPKTGQFKYIYVIIGAIIVVLILLIVISKKRDKKEKINNK